MSKFLALASLLPGSDADFDDVVMRARRRLGRQSLRLALALHALLAPFRLRSSSRLRGERPLVLLHLEGCDHLARLAEDEAAEGAGQSKQPALPFDAYAIELQNLVREFRDQHCHVEADLRQEDGLLHLPVPEHVVPDGPVEGARGVGADILRPDERDEGDCPGVHEIFLRGDVLLQDLPLTVEDKGSYVDADDDHGQDGPVEDHAAPHPAQDHRLGSGAGRLLEDGLLAGLHAESDGGWQVGHEDEEEDLQGRPHDRDPRNDAHEDLHHLGDVHGHDEGDELLDARVDGPALLNCRDDRAEVVVGEDHVRGALGHLRALDAHGDADVGLIQGRGIVHAVAGHCCDEALPLQRLHDLQLVLWPRPRKDAHG
mmetsp:Transcript_144286/g.366265  ORF Transcript_144286/g.366265 Transcript_144286/m.366265 type:complete len:371 (-) Transcript_144286:2142-3254(-)